MDTTRLIVKAVHNFKGTNNDELCFQKGDIITVSQTVDGGWWEGTLNGVTGWFPSNYVKEVKLDKDELPASLPDTVNVTCPEKVRKYRSVVFQDILDSETTHVHELQSLAKNFLIPLQLSDILTSPQWKILVGNFQDVVAFHQSLLTSLEQMRDIGNVDQQKIGGLFIHHAFQMKAVHFNYCSNHPKAVTILEKFKDKLTVFMEQHGSTNPGILALTSGLSRPFRRLEKYPGLLQELERHTEESHPDRGDTQRAIFVLRELSSTCLNMRRQKELELAIMTETIHGWEGEDIKTLGEILYVGPVNFVTEATENKDRYLVLFPQTLVILSVSANMSAFHYEGKLPVSGITVSKVESTEAHPNCFEITGEMIQKITVSCSKPEEEEKWLNLFHKQIWMNRLPPGHHHKVPHQFSSTHTYSSHSSPAHISHSAITTSIVQSTQSSPNLCLASQCERKLQPQSASLNRVSMQHPRSQPLPLPHAHPLPPAKVWNTMCLHPHPPLRLYVGTTTEKDISRKGSGRRKEKPSVLPEDKRYEDDLRILQVIEAYCTSVRTRYTLNSSLLDSPQMLIADEEKIIVEETRNNAVVLEEKSLVDTVYSLRDQVKELQKETTNLSRALEDEKKARRKLENLFQKQFAGGQEIAGLMED